MTKPSLLASPGRGGVPVLPKFCCTEIRSAPVTSPSPLASPSKGSGSPSPWVKTHESLAGACTFTQGNGEPEKLPGDANGDNQVTGSDLIAVQQNFGKTGDPGIPGDANFDGLVTGADLISVQQNFGKVAAAVVPEPATAILVIIGLASSKRRRRRGSFA